MASSKYEINQGISDGRLSYIVSVLKKKCRFPKDRIHFKCAFDGKWLVVDEEKCTIRQTVEESRLVQDNIGKAKFVSIDGMNVLILRRTFVSEGLVSALKDIVNMNRFFCKMVVKVFKGDVNTLAWILQVITVITDLHDPYVYGMSRMTTLLVRVLACALQVMGSFKQFVSESLSLTDVVLMLSIAGFPTKILSKVELFTKLSGKRFSDSAFLMSVINEFLDIVISVVEWCGEKEPTGILKMFGVKLRENLGFVTTYKLVKDMSELVSTYHKNQQIVLDVQYRIKCQELHEKILKHEPTLLFCRDAINKATFLSWGDFCNIMVLVKNYSVSSRTEPVCIVFEGPAGAGKSTFMNKIVSVLKKANLSVYCHTVPDINSGKDFYDDYMNQDVFVMDDVGQQGKSQWRSIINFVAPVKYPLECAAADKKNTKFFSSKLILCTTNSFMNLHGFTPKDSIAEPEALFRRCHVLKFGRMNAGVSNAKYYKYDYVDTKKWINGEIGVWKGLGIPKSIEHSEEKDNLKEVYVLIMKLLSLQSGLAASNEVSEDDCEYILGTGENFVDARSEGVSDIFTNMNDKVLELVRYLKTKADNLVQGTKMDATTIASLGGLLTVVGVLGFYISSITQTVDAEDNDNDISTVVNQWKSYSGKKHEMFSESGCDIACEDDKQDVRRYFRFFEIFYYHEGVMKTEYCQASVSGKYALLPLHCVGDNMSVNIFRDWEKYQSKHYEFNLVPCSIKLSYPHLDIAVIELNNLPVVPFKNANMLFKRDNVKMFSNDLYFTNCYHKIRNIYGINIKMVEDSFKVVNYRKELVFGPDSGLVYPISALGLCGSLIVDKMNGFVGMHVAGNGVDGFAIVPTKEIRSEIANAMLYSVDPNFDHKVKDLENFSGSRLEYEKAQIAYVMSKSNFRPTTMNAKFNEMVKDYCEKFNVTEKEPANVNKYGSSTTTLKKVADKSFRPLHPVPQDEIDFAKECLRTFFAKFDDLTDEETAFGCGTLLPPLNKDSANGYGYEKDKETYFDFENKIVKPEFLKRVKDVEDRIMSDTATWEDFVARESIKDEMRPLGKDPRTFRVMPLHHIYLVKKYLGKAFIHVRKNMWRNGIAIGMNPYKDWSKLYDKLRNLSVMALDFGKWDGSCHAMIQDLVNDVVMEFYTGENRKVLSVLLMSVVRGFTLVKDSLYMTTHSLPSGAWITAFFNSLINRALTAMCLYREMKKCGKRATVQDFLRIVDFVLGDDKITGVPKDLTKYFNALTLKSFAETLGMDVTDCSKKPIVTEFQKLEDCTFLKRHFRFHKDLGVVGPLALDTLFNTIQWFDCTKSYDEVMNGKSIVLQIESYIHSEEMLYIFQDMMKDEVWYREMSKEQVYAIVTRDAEETFGMVKRLLDKNYV